MTACYNMRLKKQKYKYIYVGEWGWGVEGSRLEAWMKSHKSEVAIT